MRNMLLSLVLGLLPAAFVASSASADEAETRAGARDEADYRAAIEGAVEAYTQQRYDEALGLFLKAHALSPSARTLRGIGLASFETRRYADSIRYLTDALQDSRAPLTPAMRSEAERVIRAAAPFVVHLTVDLQPADAELSVDGRAHASTQPVLLDPGVHQVVAKAQGYHDAVRTVQWQPGTQARLELHLIQAGGPAVARAPDDPARRAEPQVTPLAGGQPGKRRSRFGVLKWVTLGTAVASLAVSGAGLGVREDRARAISRVCNGELSTHDRQTCDDWHDNGHAWQLASIATGALGGALAVTTIVLFVTDRPRKADAQRARRSCQIGLGAEQVRCQVQF